MRARTTKRKARSGSTTQYEVGTRSATTRAEAVAQLIAAGVTRGSDAADDGNEAVATTAAVEPEGDTLWNKKTIHTLKIKTADGAKALFGGFHACTPLPAQLASFDKKFYRVELPIHGTYDAFDQKLRLTKCKVVVCTANE